MAPICHFNHFDHLNLNGYFFSFILDAIKYIDALYFKFSVVSLTIFPTLCVFPITCLMRCDTILIFPHLSYWDSCFTCSSCGPYSLNDVPIWCFTSGKRMKGWLTNLLFLSLPTYDPSISQEISDNSRLQFD